MNNITARAIAQNPLIMKVTFFIGTLAVVVGCMALIAGRTPSIAEGAATVNREQRMEQLRQEQITLEKQLLTVQSDYDLKLASKIEAEQVLQAKMEELTAVQEQGKSLRDEITAKEAEIVKLRDRVTDEGF